MDAVTPLRFLPIRVSLFKQMEGGQPVEILSCDPTPVTFILKEEEIPEGTEKVYILSSAFDEKTVKFEYDLETGRLIISDELKPVDCEFDAETKEITFLTETFGLFVLLFA